MSLQSLFKQTAIYGLGTMIIRFASALLTPYYTHVVDKVSIGISADLLSIIAVVNVVYMIGMETSFFRFTKDYAVDKVYATTLSTVFFNSLLWTILLCCFATPIVEFLKYPHKEIYVYLLASTAFLENMCNVPFARMRQDQRPLLFMGLKGLSVLIIVILNLFFISYLYQNGKTFFGYTIDDPVIYMFLANFIAWVILFLYFSRNIIAHIHKVDIAFFKKMFHYSLPLIIVGLAGMTNEVIDRTMLKNLLPYSLKENLAQVGIYNANYKLAVLMLLAIQAFRMGAEPYFFSQSKEKNSAKMYATIMDFFIIGCCVILTIVSILRDYIGSVNERSYLEGIYILPILLLAKLFLGIYYNTTIWYKLTDNTMKGAWITVFGTVITLGLNFYLIPKISYLGCAIATLVCYTSMTMISIVWGHRYYPIPYHYRYNLLWIGASLLFSYVVYTYFQNNLILLVGCSILYLLVVGYLTRQRWLISKSHLG